VNYRLHLIGDQWKVYDVVIENVSLVNNDRAQFNRVLVNGSYEELIRKLENREKR
jgi:phospholipid transport system substrate-binding protein